MDEQRDEHKEYLEALRLFCEALAPKKVVEFGSGASTRVFDACAQVTSIEYQPPGDWFANEGGAKLTSNAKFILVQRETQLFPRNLYEAFYALIARELGEDLQRDFKIINGAEPIWDLAFIDGAVHSEGVTVDPRFPGWIPADLSYLARASLAGLCAMVARTVIVDDVPYMPPLANLKTSRQGRFLVLSR